MSQTDPTTPSAEHTTEARERVRVEDGNATCP